MTRRRARRFRRWANVEIRRLALRAGKVAAPLEEYDHGCRTAHDFRVHFALAESDFTPGLWRASRHDRDLGGAFGRHQQIRGCGCDSCESGWCCGWVPPPLPEGGAWL